VPVLKFSFLSPIHRASRQIGLFLTGPADAEGVGTAEGHLLSYLRSYGPCSIRTLRQVFGHKPSTMTSMLERMAAQGLLTRGVSEEDRRVVRVELTRKGAGAADRLRRKLVALENAIRSRLAPREIDGFHAVMRAIEEATRLDAGGKEKTS
jgi:DNA-binding MarR family transcriptional regulator